MQYPDWISILPVKDLETAEAILKVFCTELARREVSSKFEELQIPEGSVVPSTWKSELLRDSEKGIGEYRMTDIDKVPTIDVIRVIRNNTRNLITIAINATYLSAMNGGIDHSGNVGMSQEEYDQLVGLVLWHIEKHATSLGTYVPCVAVEDDDDVEVLTALYVPIKDVGTVVDHGEQGVLSREVYAMYLMVHLFWEFYESPLAEGIVKKYMSA